MRTAKILFLFSLVVVALTCTPYVFGEEANEANENSDVHVLTTKNFDKFVKDHPVALVEFYAPWCGHCKSLAPHFEEAATKLKAAGGIPLAKVDATAETELGTRFEIRGYPSLKLFKNGEPSEYTGGRTADTIISWIESVTGPAVEIIEEAEAVAPATGVVFVARVKDEKSKAFELYEKVAEKLRLEAKFQAVVSKDAKEDVTAYRPDEPTAVIAIGTDQEALETFVNEERFPFFGPINGDNYAAYEARKHEIVWFAGKEEDFNAHSEAFRDAAKKFRQEYSFVWLDTEKFGSHAENGLGLAKIPGVVLRLREGGRYVFPEGNTYSSEALIKFFDDAKSGKIEKTLKSEPIPETNEEPVKIVVGKNFDDIVFQKEKDVMLEVYAPWCGHCKKLEPIYTELAELLSGYDHIVIGKMDGTANEPPSPDFTFKGFPTIFWVKAGETTPKTFEGARTLQGLADFIKENSSKKVEVTIEAADDAEEEVKDEL